MLSDLILIGGFVFVMAGVLEIATRPYWGPSRRPRGVSAIREAMRGPEAGAVRAEFRRSGICPPEPRRPGGFL